MASRGGGSSSSSSASARSIGLGLVTAVVTAGLLYYAIRVGSVGSGAPALPKDKKEDDLELRVDASAVADATVPASSSPDEDETNDAPATTTTTTVTLTSEELNKRVEEIDSRGKKFYKESNYLDAASCFTEALELIASSSSGAAVGSRAAESRRRQIVTLTNNRSAMYEKAGMGELALADCDAILRTEVTHQKARQRRLRILEARGDLTEALTEVCALQLRYMTDNKDRIRSGASVPQPPVPHSKIEDIMGRLLPGELKAYGERAEKEKTSTAGTARPPLPSAYTILQLLQSFSGYNAWMAAAAKGGTAAELAERANAAADGTPEKARALYRSGRRRAFDREFDDAVADFEAAHEVLETLETESDFDENEEENEDAVTVPRLLEWVAMGRHLRYDLSGAAKLYERCSELDPTNAELLVKRAGVKMDGSDHEAAHKLFAKALELDPFCVDALLHRANLHVIQSAPAKAKEDLNTVVALKPNHLLAHLRLATVHMSEADAGGGGPALERANACLEKAESIADGSSSEVHSYRGEMHFSRGEMTEALAEFEKAADLDPRNPTPHVNAALAVMNALGPGGGPPDVPGAVRMLERALAIDPQFHAAYVHLGQLRLTQATNLDEARGVVELYDRGLRFCGRTPDEIRDILSMRILTVAQIDAATALGMETLNG